MQSGRGRDWRRVELADCGDEVGVKCLWTGTSANARGRGTAVELGLRGGCTRNPSRGQAKLRKMRRLVRKTDVETGERRRYTR